MGLSRIKGHLFMSVIESRRELDNYHSEKIVNSDLLKGFKYRYNKAISNAFTESDYKSLNWTHSSRITYTKALEHLKISLDSKSSYIKQLEMEVVNQERAIDLRYLDEDIKELARQYQADRIKVVNQFYSEISKDEILEEEKPSITVDSLEKISVAQRYYLISQFIDIKQIIEAHPQLSRSSGRELLLSYLLNCSTKTSRSLLSNEYEALHTLEKKNSKKSIAVDRILTEITKKNRT